MPKSFNYTDADGNTLLLGYLLKEVDCTVEGLEFFLENGVNLSVRNNFGQSAFLIAAKCSRFILQITDCLLNHGSTVLERDNQGSSILHEVFKSPFVTLEAVEKLLKLKAPTDCRDETGKSPLAYCGCSCLQADDKERAEKMIIQHSVVNKAKMYLLNGNLKEEDFGGDFVICFNFLYEPGKIEKWKSYRDSLISEILKMKKVRLLEDSDYNLFHFLIQILDSEDPNLKDLEIKAILEELQKHEYPCFRDVLLNALATDDFNLP